MPSNDIQNTNVPISTLEICEATANSLNDLAKNFIDQSEYDKALCAAQEALDIANQIESMPQEGRALFYLGNISLHIGNYTNALEFYNRSLLLFESLGDKSRIAVILGNNGRLHRNLSDYPTAIDY